MADKKRSVTEIANEIAKVWGEKVYFAARPYLDAMRSHEFECDGHYGYDSGESIVLYFLSNATTWRGDEARRIKKELNGLIK